MPNIYFTKKEAKMLDECMLAKFDEGFGDMPLDHPDNVMLQKIIDKISKKS